MTFLCKLVCDIELDWEVLVVNTVSRLKELMNGWQFQWESARDLLHLGMDWEILVVNTVGRLES